MDKKKIILNLSGQSLKAHHKTTLYFIGNLIVFLILCLFWRNETEGKFAFVRLAGLELFLFFEITEALLKGEIMHPFWWSMKHFYV